MPGTWLRFMMSSTTRGRSFTACSRLPLGMATTSAGGLACDSTGIGCAHADAAPLRANTHRPAMKLVLLVMVTSESRLISDAKNTLVDADGLIALMRHAGLHDEPDRR